MPVLIKSSIIAVIIASTSVLILCHKNCNAAAAGENSTLSTSSATAADNNNNNNNTIISAEDEAAARNYRVRRPNFYSFRPAYRPQQFYPQQNRPSAVGYFSNNINRPNTASTASTTPVISTARSCSNKQAPLPAICQQNRLLQQCTEQARSAVCVAYDDAKLTETTRLGAAPATFANITWSADVKANLGNTLTTPQVFKAPTSVDFLARSGTFYSLLIQDAGQPGVASATRDVGTPVHWLVGNVPGTDIGAGEKVFDYFPLITPPNAATPVVFNLFVYEQPSKLTFSADELPRVPDCSFASRSFFSAEKFQEKYRLIGPQFGNFVRLANLPPTDTTLGAFTAGCAAYFTEQFKKANLPYPIQKGLTLNWPNNQIMGFGNNLQPAALGAEQPNFFQVAMNPTQKFTIVFFDQDANSNNDATGPKYINWMVVNAGFREKVNDGTPVIAYQRPAPANDGKAHRFVALSYLQPNGNIDVTSLARVARCDTSAGRSQFDLDAFVKKNNLMLIDGAYALMKNDGTTAC